MPSFRDHALKALPPSLRQAAVDLKNTLWGGYRRTHYSQFGEDVVLSGILGPKGYFVDVGANHPKRYSNTYLLYRRGWSGLNIDPNEDAIASFRSVRPRDTSVAYAIGETAGTATLYRYADPAFNTLSKEMAESLKKKQWLTPLPTKEVPVKTLAETLHEYVPEETMIDFLNVDVEGLDLEVLKTNDWTIYQPRVIAIEDHHFSADIPHQSTVYTYLHAKGYALVAHTGPTLIFKKTS